MRRSVRHAATLALAAVGALAIHGCTERLEGGAACPILCPGQNLQLRDTLVAAVELDTTLSSFPGTGEESQLVLISRRDTLETRVIVRFDTLPTTYLPAGATTEVPIEMVERAQFSIRLRYPPPHPEQTVTVEAYDVDTTLADGGSADTAAATMLPLFRPDRFLGSLTFKPIDLARDPETQAARADTTLRVPIDPAHVLAKIQAKARLRVGLLIRSDGPAELAFHSANTLRPPELLIDPSAETGVLDKTTGPYSATPSERFIANALADFVIVAQKRASEAPSDVLAVGGVPGRRAYLRFKLPSGIVDSTSVVRATLLLTQYPNRLAARGADSVSVYPQPVVASDVVTDLHRAASLLGDPRGFRLDSLRTAPGDDNPIEVEVIGLIGVWRLTQPEQATRALVLRMPTEGVSPDELYFYSTEAAEALRPRLRIVYVPRIGIGLP